ncbi:hypothetical protein ABG067_007080 [Albugo candida]
MLSTFGRGFKKRQSRRKATASIVWRNSFYIFKIFNCNSIGYQFKHVERLFRFFFFSLDVPSRSLCSCSKRGPPNQRFGSEKSSIQFVACCRHIYYQRNRTTHYSITSYAATNAFTYFCVNVHNGFSVAIFHSIKRTLSHVTAKRTKDPT